MLCSGLFFLLFFLGLTLPGLIIGLSILIRLDTSLVYFHSLVTSFIFQGPILVTYSFWRFGFFTRVILPLISKFSSSPYFPFFKLIFWTDLLGGLTFPNSFQAYLDNFSRPRIRLGITIGGGCRIDFGNKGGLKLVPLWEVTLGLTGLFHFFEDSSQYSGSRIFSPI